MKTFEEIKKTREYDDLPQRERNALRLVVEDLTNETGIGLRVQISPNEPFDIYGFRVACAAAGIKDNMPERPNRKNHSYEFKPEKDDTVRPEMIMVRNFGETLARGAASLRRLEESRK